MGKSGASARAGPAAQRKRTTASASASSSSSAAASAAASAAVAAPVSASATVAQVNEQLRTLLSTPSLFFTPNADHASTCMRGTKSLYDLAKTVSPAYLDNPDSVPRLHTDEARFSSDQIFTQMSKHTDHVLGNMSLYMKELTKRVKEQQAQIKLAEEEDEAEEQREAEAEAAAAEEQGEDDEDEEGFGAEGEDDDEDADLDEEEEDEEMEAGEDDEEGEDDEDEDEDAPKKKKASASSTEGAGAYKGRGGIVEDAFFSLDDMEKFADQFEDDNDQGDIDLNGSDEDGAGEDLDEDEEDRDEEDEDDEEEDEAMDVRALARKAIRAKHEGTLKPLARPLREEEVDLDEDVGAVDLTNPERYEDFFDPPAPELLKGGSKGKRGDKNSSKGNKATTAAGKKAKSMEAHYAEEDANEETYVDEDFTDEFGGTFKQLSQAGRSGLLGGPSAKKAANTEEDDEEALAASAPLATGAAAAAAAAPTGPESNYEKSARKLAGQIAALENKIVQPREWAQLGEVSGKNRPVDALLTTNLEFEHAGKVAPVITQAYTEELEALIKRRIIAEQFDDVVRKSESDLPGGAGGRKPKNAAPEVSDEKSALGLGDVYAAEQQATLDAAEGKASAADEKVAKAHKDLSEHLSDLFHKLDALCNFHFTPRSIHADELAVRSHAGAGGVAAGSGKAVSSHVISSISLEEALPMHMSSGATLAPQEAYDIRGQQAMVGETERSSEEKSSRRRRIKAQRKKKTDAQTAREKHTIAGMGDAAKGNAAEGILRKAISSKEMQAATTARNVVQAGGKGAGGAPSAKKSGKPTVVAHGQNTKFGSSGAFFGKMQGVAADSANKKQRTK